MKYLDENGIKEAFKQYLTEKCGYDVTEAEDAVRDFPDIFVVDYIISGFSRQEYPGGIKCRVISCRAYDPRLSSSVGCRDLFAFSILLREEDLRDGFRKGFKEAKKLYRLETFSLEKDRNEALADLGIAFRRESADEAELVVEDSRELYIGNLEAEAVELAVKYGCREYLERHIEDYGAREKSALYEFADEEMAEFLAELGIRRSLEDFKGYRLAIDTVNGTLVSFTHAFQKELFEKYLSLRDMSEKEALEMLEEDEEDEGTMILPDLASACELLGIAEKDGTFVAEPFEWLDTGVDVSDLEYLVEMLGYKFDFVDELWKPGCDDVDFIK